MESTRRRIRAQGVVQGVGFRPFVYREAVGLGLVGSVRNLGDAGVEILVEGSAEAIDAFVRALRENSPPLAHVASLEAEELPPTRETAFVIAPSDARDGGHGSLPPDTSICSACMEDVRGGSRYAGYWATSCTDCGPRFTVIEGLPYDRPQTSMVDFPMCDRCTVEYRDPLDRRYHAQTIACATCGPRLTFDGTTDNPIDRAMDALASGEIVAVKGIGGTHIACRADDEGVLQTLRRRLGRPGQPFALMGSEEALHRIAQLADAELDLLRSPRRPIVVVRQRECALPESVAPGLDTVGVMLPYTGLHVILFDRLDGPLVMTSANRPGEPMLIDNDAISVRLADVVEHELLHDRRIVARCDDSVRRVVGGAAVFLRRSRGHVPEEIVADLGEEAILALGPESDLTFTVYADGRAVPSQHIGSVNDVETYEFLLAAIDHLKRLTGFSTPEVVACDLHSDFLTTKLAREIVRATGARLVPVQHHVAHLASVAAETGVDRAVGILLDGYGFGPGGTAWGGEILVVEDARVERTGSLAPVRLPGGDAAARSPLRMSASLLHAAGWPSDRIVVELVDRGIPRNRAEALLTQIERGVNAPWTTSAGRFLDAVAAWLGIGRERTYEGEPAMRLEAAARAAAPIDLTAPIVRRDDRAVLDTADLFRSLVDLAASEDASVISATAQTALAEGIAGMAVREAQARGIETVAFSGGVAYNDAIASRIRQMIEGAGLRYVTNVRVPCGDGGVSFGQAVSAGLRWRLLEADGADAAAGGESGKGDQTEEEKR